MIYDDLLRPRAICRRVSEGQYVVGSVVEGGAFCRGDNSSCNRFIHTFLSAFRPGQFGVESTWHLTSR